MKNGFFLLLFLAALPATAGAQHRLSGLWEGVITTGGIYSREGHKFELYLDVNGNKLSGKSYVYLADDKVIEMAVKGNLYTDLSIYMEDIHFITAGDTEFRPRFRRKYQLVFNRSIWEKNLEGYWQEVRVDTLNEKRERGRVFLKKVTNSKA